MVRCSPEDYVLLLSSHKYISQGDTTHPQRHPRYPEYMLADDEVNNLWILAKSDTYILLRRSEPPSIIASTQETACVRVDRSVGISRGDFNDLG
ncbi:hypothetical protein FRB91_006311 [Serendipita sp. 411]|nr:hypothetical protein FRB91_006311 [Serendipita sp. 411]